MQQNLINTIFNYSNSPDRSAEIEIGNNSASEFDAKFNNNRANCCIN